MSLHRYLTGLASAMEIDVGTFDRAGTSVIGAEDRRDQLLVSHYRVGAHSVLWTDPDLVDELDAWHGRSVPVAFDDFREWMVDHRATQLGGGYEHVLPGPFEPPAQPAEVAVLDPDADRSVALVGALQSACSESDLDEADFDIEHLDRHLVGWIENDHLLAVAGGRTWDPRPGFHDIGVLVHPDARRSGRGRSVIAAVARLVLDAGSDPLYRCSIDNEGSWRLCRGLGFERVVELEAFTWQA